MATTRWRYYRITANYTGSKKAPWGDGMPTNWNHHKITITNTKIGVRISFDFWASIMNPELRSPSDLRGAFECFLSDACAGAESFGEFCSNTGFDTDSREAERTWKACQKAHTKALRLLGDEDLYNTANALRD